MEKNNQLETILNKLNQNQVRLCIDDFGTGYSSLAYLHLFPISILKLDKSFIDDLEVNNKKRTIIEGILALANKINIEVVAEGIETAKQLEFLKAVGCQYGQGYLFSRPMDLQTTEKYLSSLANNLQK